MIKFYNKKIDWRDMSETSNANVRMGSIRGGSLLRGPGMGGHSNTPNVCSNELQYEKRSNIF